MTNESVVFWGLAVFCSTFAFSARKQLVCILVFGVGLLLLGLYGAGMLAETFWTEQIQTMWNVFGMFGTSNLLINLGAGSFGKWLGTAYAG